jgi:phosphoglycerate dehydrogenase-like enzyme
MRVIGISSGSREVPGFDRLYRREQLHEAVGEVDYLVVLTPYSTQTHHIIDAKVLGRMKQGAFLVNLARGGVVNELDLAQALRDKIIRGAALDVFHQEPLPPESELWSLPNVIISPHLGGLNSSYPRSVLPLVVENIRLFAAGRQSEMRNVVPR